MRRLWASLAADKSPVVPYSREMADQRRKYGENMLRRCEEHLTTQRQYEEENHKKLQEARQRRQAEKDRIDAAEVRYRFTHALRSAYCPALNLKLTRVYQQREERERLRIQNEKLAAERRIAREQAQQWTREVKRIESDEEREKTAKKAKRVKRENVSGDEAAGSGPGGAGGEPKAKKRRGKLKKSGESGGEEEALFSGDEEEQRPRKVSRLSPLTRRYVVDIGDCRL